MSRHYGILPEEYVEKLKRMSLEEIVKEAAHFRSDGKRNGTSTALILRWALRYKVAEGGKNDFLALYRTAWEAEKTARAVGTSSRPSDRPVIGDHRRRSRRNSLDRHGFVVA